MKWAAWLLVVLVLVPTVRAADLPAATPAARRGPPPIRYLILVRHGWYTRTPGADDRLGNGLDSIGRAQSALTGRRLAAAGVKYTSLMCSDFTRARQTAEVMGSILEMKPVADTLLRECTPLTERADYMRNHSAQEIATCDANLAAAWSKYARPAVGEDARDVLVCHGNVIRWFVCRALGMDTKKWSSMEIANASLTVIAVRPDGTTRLLAFSDAGHVPSERQTWTSSGGSWATTRR